MVTVFVFGVGFGTGFGAATTLGAGEHTNLTQRSAASAERGMLAIWEGLGQLTRATTGFGVTTAVGLAAGLGARLGAGFGAGFGFGFGGTETVTVLVIVWVVVDPAEELDDPTQTVTDPDPILDP